MNKNNKNNPVEYVIYFLAKIAMIYALIPVFTASAVVTPSKDFEKIYQPHYYSHMTCDVECANKGQPDTPEKFINMLKSKLEEHGISYLFRKKVVHNSGDAEEIARDPYPRTSYYLDMKTLDDVNNVIFILQGIYGSEIESDTAGILLIHQLTQRRLNITLLHKFLTARVNAPKDKLINRKHLYHHYLTTILAEPRVAIKYIDEEDLAAKLADNLPAAESRMIHKMIILFTQRHVSVIRALPEKMYEYSMWDAANGISYRESHLDELNEDDFKCEHCRVWDHMGCDAVDPLEHAVD